MEIRSIYTSGRTVNQITAADTQEVARLDLCGLGYCFVSLLLTLSLMERPWKANAAFCRVVEASGAAEQVKQPVNSGAKADSSLTENFCSGHASKTIAKYFKWKRCSQCTLFDLGFSPF